MKKNILKITVGLVMSATILGACGTTNGNVADLPTRELVEVEKQEDLEIATNEEEKLNNMNEENDTQEEKDEQETEEEVVEEGFSFSQLSNVSFWFSSGAGGWGTELSIKEDGTFEGIYSDSDMGDTGEGYPYGTRYLCKFSGEFTKPEKVNDYTYSMKIENMVYEDKPNTEEILDDGVKYCYSEPYGLTDGNEFLIYLPESPLDELPEEYLSWINHYMYGETEKTTLPFYGIYNVNAQCGFGSDGTVTEEMEEETIVSSKSDNLSEEMTKELAKVEEEAASIEMEMQEVSVTQVELNDASMRLYETWDKELNSIWSRLKEQMPEDEFETLLTAQRLWISYKEEEVKRAGLGCEGGSMQPMLEYGRAAELTKVRVYELAVMLK